MKEMTNKGINEELLEDIQAIVKKDISWKSMHKDPPKMVLGNTIVVYSPVTRRMIIMEVCLYRENNNIPMWVNIGVKNSSGYTVFNKDDLWREIDIKEPSYEEIENLKNKRPQ